MIRDLKKKLTDHWAGGVIGGALSALLGVSLFFFGFADGLKRHSYDLPYAVGRIIPPPEVVLIYLDETSHVELKQSYNVPWDRSLHAELVQRLTAAQAKAVAFDIVFTDPYTNNPVADQKFAQALKANGKCILAAELVESVMPESGVRETLDGRPLPLLREAAAGWGVIEFDPDPGFVIRRGPVSDEDHPTLSWAVAKLVGAEVTKKLSRPPQNFWLKYYGPPGTIPSVSYSHVLEGGVRPDFFRNKIILIGARQSTAFSGAGKDEFGTGFTLLTRSYAPGVEIHATALINLLRQDWVRMMPRSLEVAHLVVLGILFGFGLSKFRPLPATGVAVALMMVGPAAGWALFYFKNLWFAWAINLAQILVALLWSLLFNSFRWYVERRVMVDSLESYLSPARAQQVLKNPKLLQPGGEEQEVSILFSDIAGYSKITGKMDTDDIFKLLNKYYETTLTCVHRTDGTVVQLIGDAIFAIWNAPLPQPDHQRQACRAALQLRDELVRFDASERSLPLRTRIGLHTGVACVGNLGSRKRFVYAAIGDPTNLASRLEGLNKHLGTNILASRAILKGVHEQFVSRLVGHFRFKGFDKVVEVHELVDLSDKAEASKPWRQCFADALHAFQRKAFDEAEAGFRHTQELHKDDGPSQFYLERIPLLRGETLPYDWTGEVDLKEK